MLKMDQNTIDEFKAYLTALCLKRERIDSMIIVWRGLLVSY